MIFYKAEQGPLGMSLWNQGDGGPKKLGNHWYRRLTYAELLMTVTRDLETAACELHNPHPKTIQMSSSATHRCYRTVAFKWLNFDIKPSNYLLIFFQTKFLFSLTVVGGTVSTSGLERSPKKIDIHTSVWFISCLLMLYEWPL